MSKMMPLVWVSCINWINVSKYGLSFICHFQKTISEDNNGDFRKRVKLENGAEFLLMLAFTDVISDTEHHFHFRAVGRGFEGV